MAAEKAQKNRLGVKGWAFAGRYGMERWAYTLHRISGLGILLYFILHIFVTGTRLGGEAAWTATMEKLDTPLFKFGEFLIFLAFIYHAFNGIRLVIAELGMMMGKPMRPVHPYVNSVRRQRPLFILIMIVAALLMVLGGFDFYLI